MTVKYMENKKIYAWEPWFLIFFGIFHLHRIWGLFDRQSYADFWIGIMQQKGVFYFVLMVLLFMFDVNSPYWNMVWGFFILLGAFVFSLGVKLIKHRRMKR